MFGDQSGRIRVLSDAVKDLNSTLRYGIDAYRSGRKVNVNTGDGLARPIAETAKAVSALASQLSEVSSALRRVSGSAVGMLMGSAANAEIQKLTANIDDIRDTLEVMLQHVGR